MQVYKEALKDAPAYLLGVGHDDRVSLAAALRNEGSGAVVRLGFNLATETVPLRMLGYIASAYYTTSRYMPQAQLQLVATTHAAARVNAVPIEKGKAWATALFRHIAEHQILDTLRPQHTIFGFDSPDEPQLAASAIESATRDLPEAVILRRSAQSRGATVAPYVAAHIALHDTPSNIQPLTELSDERPWPQPSHIISIGAHGSERPFYAARKQCRRQGVFEPSTSTGQLFTRHIIPPYLFSRSAESEPLITDEKAAHALVMNPRPPRDHVSNDIRYVGNILGEVEDILEIFGPQTNTQLARNIQVSAQDVDYWHTHDPQVPVTWANAAPMLL